MKQLKITDTHSAVSELFKHCLTTYRHSLRVGDELYRFACYLDMDDTDKIYMLGVLHDIGKLHIPHSLLNKTTSLTQKEFEYIQMHAEFGQIILNNIDGLPAEYATVVRYHHENIDGSGYFGIKDKNIPLLSKMLRIIDSYDTILYGRIYQRHKTHHEAINEICSLSGKHYEPELTQAFKKFLNEKYRIIAM